jgi:hypothetical protein
MALEKKNEETTSRLSPDERFSMYTEKKKAAMKKALDGEKIRYRSNRNSENFKNFLENRLTIWDDMKDKTFYGKRMYEKTKTLIDNWN